MAAGIQAAGSSPMSIPRKRADATPTTVIGKLLTRILRSKTSGAPPGAVCQYWCDSTDGMRARPDVVRVVEEPPPGRHDAEHWEVGAGDDLGADGLRLLALAARAVHPRRVGGRGRVEEPVLLYEVPAKRGTT
jgi:hypothetical protein